jgi:hypothetical protein
MFVENIAGMVTGRRDPSANLMFAFHNLSFCESACADGLAPCDFNSNRPKRAAVMA